jgi:hypothetical protein
MRPAYGRDHAARPPVQSGGGPIAMHSPLASLVLPQHPDEHRSKGPVLLAVDQQLSEGAALRVAPELSDPVGPLESGSMRMWSSSARGAGPRAPLPESALEIDAEPSAVDTAIMQSLMNAGPRRPPGVHGLRATDRRCDPSEHADRAAPLGRV